MFRFVLFGPFLESLVVARFEENPFLPISAVVDVVKSFGRKETSRCRHCFYCPIGVNPWGWGGVGVEVELDMRIGVDAQTLLRQDAGVTYYTKGLLEEVLKQDRENHYDLLLWQLFPKPPVFMFGKGRNFSYHYQRFFPYKIFYKLHKWGINIPLEIFFPARAPSLKLWSVGDRIPEQSRRGEGGGRYDLYFFPNFVAYPHVGGKSVVTVHDLSFEKVPQFVFKKNVDFLKKFVPPSVRSADLVVAISQNTKKDLIETYGIPEKKIAIVNPGVDPRVFYSRSEEEKVAVKGKYGIEKPFLLYLGTLEPRKNVSAIVRAYAALPNRRDFNLVLAGKKGWFYEEVFRIVEDLGLREEVIFTGYVSDEDRPRLFSAAEVFVYPSFFEGFGMPVVEAQACGTPVVTSNTTSLPEAVGEGGIFIDPRDVSALSNAIAEIISSSSRRTELSEKGLRNARRFRWEESGRKLLKIFNHLGAQV